MLSYISASSNYYYDSDDPEQKPTYDFPIHTLPILFPWQKFYNQNGRVLINEPKNLFELPLKELILFLLKVNLLYHPICSKCNGAMNLVSNKRRLDQYEFRCHKSDHDIKCNLRKDSIFEHSNLPLQGLFCICFKCFVDNKPLAEVQNEVHQLMKDNCGYSKPAIISFYKKLRQKLALKIHSYWSLNPLGIFPAEKGIPRVELDETHLGTFNGVQMWVFGMYDRSTKDIRLFTVGNNRTKEYLLSYILYNVSTYIDRDDISSDLHRNLIRKEDVRTRIYTDCFKAYNTEAIESYGFAHRKVNHSITFGGVLFILIQ